MAHTQKRLAAGFQALCEAVSVSGLNFLNLSPAEASSEAIKVLEKVSGLADDAWAALPADAQKLFDAAAEMSNGGKDPISILIETVEVPDKPAAGDAKPTPTKAEVKPRTAVSQSTGESKPVTEASKGRFGGGARKNPATDWARKYVLAHPDANPADVMKATHEQNFPNPVSKGTIDSLVFEMRSALRIIKESGFTLVKS